MTAKLGGRETEYSQKQRPRGMPNTWEIRRKTKGHYRERAHMDRCTPVIPALRNQGRRIFSGLSNIPRFRFLYPYIYFRGWGQAEVRGQLSGGVLLFSDHQVSGKHLSSTEPSYQPQGDPLSEQNIHERGTSSSQKETKAHGACQPRKARTDRQTPSARNQSYPVWPNNTEHTQTSSPTLPHPGSFLILQRAHCLLGRSLDCLECLAYPGPTFCSCLNGFYL